MSLYGKLGGMLLSSVIVGAAGAYIANVGIGVAADTERLAAATACYIVKGYSGGIAIFKEGSERPITELALPVEGVSAADAKLLEEGIRIRGTYDLLRLLEDLNIDGYIGIIQP